MEPVLTHPSPLIGEGCQDLAALPPSRGWMGVSGAPDPHPHPTFARCWRTRLRYPSPIKGEGFSSSRDYTPERELFSSPARAIALPRARTSRFQPVSACWKKRTGCQLCQLIPTLPTLPPRWGKDAKTWRLGRLVAAGWGCPVPRTLTPTQPSPSRGRGSFRPALASNRAGG